MDKDKEKIQLILEAVQSYCSGSFDTQIPISDDVDELDALAVGINMLFEEANEKREDLENKGKELEQKISEMQRLNDLAIGRELKMVELKKQIKSLEKKCNIKKK